MNPYRIIPGGGHWAGNRTDIHDEEAAAPHSDGYNMLFCDSHVELVKRKDYLFPPRSAPHWNRDNQPHPELWAPTSDWVVQN
jgi:prepilin-type processing-associated H-X9-DG protein